MRIVTVFLLFSLSTLSFGQSTSRPRNFSVDEIAIYREFLRTYSDYSESLTDLLGLEHNVGQFRVEALGGDSKRNEAVIATLLLPEWTMRRLPRSVTSMASEEKVLRRMKAAGTPVNRAHQLWQGPDGFVRTHLVLSDIAFDRDRRHAVLIYSANCGCKGGGGGSLLYELKDGHWKMLRGLGGWEG